MNYPIHDILPYGRERAVPAPLLANILGLPSERELRKAIERERHSGAVILSCENGYFRSEDPQELQQYIHKMESSANSINKAAESAKAFLDSITGQSRIEGWWE